MVERVLIANRGEIAVRILRACRSMGLEAVVAHSEADTDSRAVRMADEAICIGPAESARSYLSAASVISAALVSGCDAITTGVIAVGESGRTDDGVRQTDVGHRACIDHGDDAALAKEGIFPDQVSAGVQEIGISFGYSLDVGCLYV